ncbi:MAG TPA: YdcF family protein [Trichocoleus sp.]
MFSLIGLLLLFSLIPVRLAIAAYQVPRPQAILVLGGDPHREKAAAQIARSYSSLDVWVSSGSSPADIDSIFQAAAVPQSRIHLDYRATDTVTNFTTLVPELKQHQIQHLYLITSDFHMPRARAIATLILGSQGITFTPITVLSDEPQEPPLSTVRDVGRSLLWIVTGRTGANFGRLLESRFPEIAD